MTPGKPGSKFEHGLVAVSRHERLSDRAYQVFRRLALGKTVKEVAAELHVSMQTVSTHRARILAKMGFRSNADLTEYAIRDHLLE